MFQKFALTILALALSGCASIDTINGVRMNASTAPDATYCDRNPTVCILLGSGAIGGLGAIFLANRDHHNSAVSVPHCQTAGGHNAACVNL